MYVVHIIIIYETFKVPQDSTKVKMKISLRENPRRKKERNKIKRNKIRGKMGLWLTDKELANDAIKDIHVGQIFRSTTQTIKFTMGHIIM